MRKKKTEEQKFAYQLKKPDSMIAKTVDYFTHHDIVGYSKAIQLQSTSKEVLFVKMNQARYCLKLLKTPE